jgi:hypothetical protein
MAGWVPIGHVGVIRVQVASVVSSRTLCLRDRQENFEDEARRVEPMYLNPGACLASP